MHDRLDKYFKSKEVLESRTDENCQSNVSSADVNESVAPSVASGHADQPIEELRRAVASYGDPHDQAYRISLRSRAEEEIVNDAKRKKVMLEMCEQNINGDASNSCRYSITRLRGLRILNLSTCNRISDVSLRYNFKFLELKSLNLSRCQQISSEGIEACLPQCPSLEIINLSECHNINDRAIEAIATQVKRLTHLHIERCIHLTDHSLDHIAVNCKRLRFLDVRGCRSMCSQPNLRVEHIRSLKQIVSSKPGPYLPAMDATTVKRPKPPPMPSAF